MSRGVVSIHGGNGKVEPGADPETRAPGRTERDQQQAVTQPKVVADKIDELERLCVKAQDAAKAYGDAVKKVAEKSGYLASNVRALVQARVKDKFGDKKRDAEQQLELFTEVGE